jgi:outer membrane receptor for ferric coprogen and ferric-rhodotorulic acid
VPAENLSIGWNARSDGGQPRLSLQFNVENVSNKVYLLSKESTMVQGQYSHPRLISASMRFRF